MKLLLALAVGAFGGATFSADAATYIQSSVVALSNDGESNGQIYGTYFDPTLGTLTSTTFRFTGSVTPSFQIVAAPPPSSPVSITPYIDVRVSGQFNLLGESASAPSDSRNFTAPSQSFDISGTLFGNYVALSHADSLITYALLNSPYAGVRPLPSVGIYSTSFGRGAFEVDYNYTPAPEPSSLMILSISLLGFVGMAGATRWVRS